MNRLEALQQLIEDVANIHAEQLMKDHPGMYSFETWVGYEDWKRAWTLSGQMDFPTSTPMGHAYRAVRRISDYDLSLPMHSAEQYVKEKVYEIFDECKKAGQDAVKGIRVVTAGDTIHEGKVVTVTDGYAKPFNIEPNMINYGKPGEKVTTIGDGHQRVQFDTVPNNNEPPQRARTGDDLIIRRTKRAISLSD